jgi:ABC-type multidrug transport system ATPase subunit
MLLSPAACIALGVQSVLVSAAYDTSPLVWDKKEGASQLGILQPVLFMVVQGIFYMVLCVTIESTHGNSKLACLRSLVFKFRSCKARCRCGRGGTQAAVAADMSALEDEDVTAERAQVDADANAGAGAGHSDEYAVRLSHLRKQYYPRGTEAVGTLAVADLCVRMKRGECFALLGTNGAGKSTTFDMMLRKQVPTAGRVLVNGIDTSQMDAAEGLMDLGYCPQHNALFDDLTGREMMAFFCAIRGVPRGTAVFDAEVQARLRDADLLEHADRRCGLYSGGNKRKLSMAVALCGNPTLAVLDEPSAGVDPAARRRLWRVVNSSLARGCTVALTTHHMQEAAHLGSRIGIMVNGRLVGIGSPQHLKLKYGQGYEVFVNMAEGAAKGVSAEVIPLLRRLCPKATVSDKPNERFVRMALGKAGEDFVLPAVFEELEAAKSTMEIESFAVTQADLENVFVQFAKKGGDAKTNAKKAGDKLLTLDVNAEKILKKQKLPMEAPEELGHFDAGEWDHVATTIYAAHARGDPFHGKEGLQCLFWCVPFLCLQPLLCWTCFRPLLLHVYRGLQAAAREAEVELSAALAHKGISVAWRTMDQKLDFVKAETDANSAGAAGAAGAGPAPPAPSARMDRAAVARKL